MGLLAAKVKDQVFNFNTSGQPAESQEVEMKS